MPYDDYGYDDGYPDYDDGHPDYDDGHPDYDDGGGSGTGPGSTFTGGSGTITGTSGVDTVQYPNLNIGDVTISGGGSKDGGWTVQYSSSSSGSDSKSGGSTDSKSGGGGTDTLSSIERLQFADGNVALDLQVSDNAGAALALLYAAFNTIPDAETLGQWIYQADSLASSFSKSGGSTMEGLAQAIIDHYAPGGVDNGSLVHLLYGNVIGEPPSEEDAGYFVGLLDDGTYSQAGLYALAASTPLNTDHYADLIGNGLVYTPYTTSKMG